MAEPQNLIEGKRDPVPGIDPERGMIIRGGEADPANVKREALHKGVWTRPPLIFVQPDGTVIDLNPAWDAYQAKHRAIKVRVVCHPPVGISSATGQPVQNAGYWSAKRFWAGGVTETLVSPHELHELQSEAPNRIQVEVLSARKQAPSVRALIDQLKAEAIRKYDEDQRALDGGFAGEEEPAAAVPPNPEEQLKSKLLKGK